MTQREELPIDVLFVGGGAASLAGAIHLKRESKKNNLDIEYITVGNNLTNTCED